MFPSLFLMVQSRLSLLGEISQIPLISIGVQEFTCFAWGWKSSPHKCILNYNVKLFAHEILLKWLHLYPNYFLFLLSSIDFEQADFKREIVSMNDLHEGMVVTGRVTNTALFGAFVDIGVGRSGLIPKRFITPDKLPVDQRQRSLALGPGERVEVRVINVDLQRNRITLDLIRVLR